MISIFDACIDCYQGILMALFFRTVLGEKRGNRVTAVVFGILTGAVLILWETLELPLPDTLVYLIPLVYILIFLKGTVWVRMIWLLIAILVFGTTAQITTGMFLFFTDLEALFRPGMLHVAYCMSANIAATGCLIIVVRISSQDRLALLGRRNVGIFLVCYTLEAVAEELLYVYQLSCDGGGIYLLGLNTAIAGLVILTMALQSTMAQTIRKKQSVEALNQILKETDKHQKEIEAIYRDVLKNQHTLRYQIDLVKNAMNYPSDTESADLIRQLDQQMDKSVLFKTGCNAIDALLTAKHLSMRQRGIVFHPQLCPLNETPDITSLCVILSNLLDNAIEAIERIRDPDSKKVVNLEISRSWDMLYLRCVNTMDPSTLKLENQIYQSSKDPQRLHGYGLASIQDITEQLQGSCRIQPYPERAIFTVQISLPIDKIPEKQSL